ncbi:hypothetical protein DPMN_090039 [Dreissena polymorpha]|uniref:Uncharacterized protein n=1 Tax=Dreissena polymorpha TaxID=45954 RepID=A0A9D4QYN3_DREPO|nr:hypothetical protein DPMN_090039 [Dreissena polymorpha]
MQMSESASVKHEQPSIIWGSSEIGITTKIRLFNSHREATTLLWSRNPENHCHHHKENKGLHQHQPQEDL